MMRLSKTLFWLAGLLALSAGLCQAQVTERAGPKTNPRPVGASEIFHALTQPDRPEEIETLRGLRELLGRTPDRITLEQVRQQIDALLRKQEREQSEMPPALVMSGIASRIDSAVAGLEEARRAPPQAAIPPLPKQPAWLIPALAAAAGTMAVALLACLIALANHGSASEGTDEIRDALAKIRRRLDDAASSAGKAPGVSEAERDDATAAAAAVHDAAIAAGRLNTTIKEADAKLRSTVDEADSRLNAAAGVAGQFEQWLESLPARLAEAVATMEESGLMRLDEAAAQVAGSISALAELASSLPAMQQAIKAAADEMGQSREETAQALSALAARAEQAAEALPAIQALSAEAASAQILVTRGAEALEAGRVAMEAALARGAETGSVFQPMPDPASEQIGHPETQAIAATLAEFAGSAELLTELVHLTYGHALRLEEAVTRSAGAMEGLPAIELALNAAAARLQNQPPQDTRSAMAELPDAAALQRILADTAEAIQTRGIEAMDLAAGRLAGSAASAAEAALHLPQAQAALQDAAACVSQAGSAQGAMWEDAVARITVLAQAAPKVAEALASSTLALKADLSSAAEGLAASRDAVIQAVEAASAASAGLNTGTARFQAVLEAASGLPAQTAALIEAAQRVSANADAGDGGDEPGPRGGEHAPAALAAVQDMADWLQRIAARMEVELEEASAARARADADFLAGQAAQADSFGAILEALAARADASLGVLPAEASALAAVSAELREDAAALSLAAERLAGGTASEAIVLSAGMSQALETLNTACRRLEEHWASTGAAEAASGQDMASLRDETRRMLAELDGAQQSVANFAREAGSATQEAAAMLARAEHRLVTASATLSNSEANGVLALQTERLADLLDSGVQIAARLEAASQAALAPAETEDRPEPRLAGLEAAISTVQEAASRLAQGAQAQEVALTRVSEAAARVAALALADASREDGPANALGSEVSLKGLASMATQTETLQTEAERLAQAALRGDAVALSPELVSQTPIFPATIETSIHRLRGAATALALASDAQRKAA